MEELKQLIEIRDNLQKQIDSLNELITSKSADVGVVEKPYVIPLSH